MLRFMGSQRVGHDWATELNWTDINWITLFSLTSPGFPHSSVAKESACNAGDTGWIPGSGRSSGERIGYPLQYSWASLVAQLVKNLPAMGETWVWSLGWKDSLEKGKAYPFQYSDLENSMNCILHRVTKSHIWLRDFHFHFLSLQRLPTFPGLWSISFNIGAGAHTTISFFCLLLPVFPFKH